MDEFVIGATAHPPLDYTLIKEAGIQWLRHGFPVPFEDKIGGRLSERYLKAKQRAQERAGMGFRLMGRTPQPGSGTYEPDQDGNLRLVWHRRLPEWFGEAGSDRYCRTYQEMCAWMAEDLAGLVPLWQIANELEVPQFAGPLNLAQACELIKAGARGLKAADPSLTVGHNAGGSGPSYFLFGRLYQCGEELLDYCGVDQYYGSWQRGGPRDWGPRIEEVHAITGRPVLINEWGFASAGGVMTDEERALGAPNCQLKKWSKTWGPGHTPEGQAEFIRTALETFAEQRDKMLGFFFFRWRDTETCWQCGEPDCPVETAWGAVDRQGRPKPSYYALKEGITRLAAGE
ncbi:MAG: hypothetical protein R6V05_00135 [Candidatus Brocadiia bacterium]